MSTRGLVRGMEPASTGPRADFLGARELDFAGALAALHELLGRWVTVFVLGGLREGRNAPLALRGALECGDELGRDDGSPLCFEVGGALLMVSPDTFAGAWRHEYCRRSDGRHWLVVTLHYDGGAVVQLEELI